jgi:tRNA(Arg) A34 adenosine deaminase TadA
MTHDDETFLRRAIDLATQRRAAGGAPFTALLVGDDGTVLAEDHNTVRDDDDITAHAALKLSRWTARNLTPEAASGTTMYTSCQPCAMCTGAVERAGLRQVIYALSSEGLASMNPHETYTNVLMISGGLATEARAAVGDYLDAGDPYGA